MRKNSTMKEYSGHKKDGKANALQSHLLKVFHIPLFSSCPQFSIFKQVRFCIESALFRFPELQECNQFYDYNRYFLYDVETNGKTTRFLQVLKYSRHCSAYEYWQYEYAIKRFNYDYQTSKKRRAYLFGRHKIWKWIHFRVWKIFLSSLNGLFRMDDLLNCCFVLNVVRFGRLVRISTDNAYAHISDCIFAIT